MSDKEKKYWRDCPNPDGNKKCKGKIGYLLELRMLEAKDRGMLCKGCAIIHSCSKDKIFFRECPECKKQIGYVSEMGFNSANKRNILCKSCGQKGEKNNALGKIISEETRKKISESSKGRKQTDETKRKKSESLKKYYSILENRTKLDEIRPKEVSEETKLKMSISRKGKKKSEEFKQNLAVKMKGENNPFYGKHHSDETKRILAEKNKNVSEEHRKKISEMRKNSVTSEETKKKLSIARKGKYVGPDNPMYGKEHTKSAKQKMSDAGLGRKKTEEWKKLMSQLTTGRRLPTKTNGNRRGISGYYKDFHFRSSCELNFLLSNDITKLRTAEVFEFKIYYEDLNGKGHYYYPDFMMDEKCLIEIKPIGWENLEGSEIINVKRMAAEKFCIKKGFEYKIITINCIGISTIYRMRRKGLVTLETNWEKQYQEWINKRFEMEDFDLKNNYKIEDKIEVVKNA